MARWRTWDLEMEDVLLASKPREVEPEPIIIAGSLKEIPHIDINSIVLPKGALISTGNNHSGRSRGRGRSLANRALGCDKPSRRPGQRENSDKGRGSPKPTLKSKFFGSEYLYEELFPSLDQTSSKKAALKPSVPTKSIKEKWKEEQPSQLLSTKFGEQDKNVEGLILEKSSDDSMSISDNEDVSKGGTNYKDQVKFLSSNFYNCTNDADFCESEKDNKHKIELSNTTTEKDDWPEVELGTIGENVPLSSPCLAVKTEPEKFNQETFHEFNQLPDKNETEDCQISTNISKKIMIESEQLHEEKQSEHLPDNLEIDDWKISPNKKDDYFQEVDLMEGDTQDSQEFVQQCNTDKARVCDQLSSCPGDKTLICDKLKTVQILACDDDVSAEYNRDVTTDDHSLQQQESNTDLTQPEDENTDDVVSTKNYLSHSNCDDSEYKPESHRERNNVKENLELSLDLSESEEMEPCNVLLENLPLALTEEELGDIVEPYGEMVSFNFKNVDDTRQTCVVRMTNSMSGELLVVSLDGLEMDGYRMKATVADS